MDLWLRLTLARPDRRHEVQPLLISGPRHYCDRRGGRTHPRRLGDVELAQPGRLEQLERALVGAVAERGGRHQLECGGAGKGAHHAANHRVAAGGGAGFRRAASGACHAPPCTMAEEPAVQFTTH